MNTPGAKRDLGAGQGRQMRKRIGMGIAADAGMRLGVQARAAEDGGWRVRATPRWAALHNKRGGRARVK